MTLGRLTRHLERRSVPFEVFVPDGEGEAADADPIHRFASLPFFLYPDCRMAFPFPHAVGKRLRQFRPDLLHLATPFNMGLCGLHYGKKLGIPRVASYHTHFDRYLSYYRLGFAGRWIWRYLRWFHRTCRLTFAPSEETRQHLLRHGIGPVELWKRGVDNALFHPGRRNAGLRGRYGIREPYVLLYAGRLAPEKDLDLLPDAAAMLPEDLAGRIRWLIVGEGPLEEMLRQRMPKNTTFAGFLAGESLAEAYASSDLLVFPSGTETFGNVVLEAHASGLPVLSVRSGGVQEIVRDGVTGRLCAPRCAEALASGIRELLGAADTLAAMGRNGRRYALTQSWDAIFDRLLEQYERAAVAAAPEWRPTTA